MFDMCPCMALEHGYGVISLSPKFGGWNEFLLWSVRVGKRGARQGRGGRGGASGLRKGWGQNGSVLHDKLRHFCRSGRGFV